MKRKIYKKRSFMSLYLIIIFILAIGAGSFFPSFNATQNEEKTAANSKSAEIEKILEEEDAAEQAKLYLKLIKRVGPEQAQDELQNSGAPFNGPMHLLNHSAGDYIWKIYGAAGITRCRDYFSYSCYHGFILNAIGDGNLKNIDAIMAECKKQGMASYDQCSHAVGHGFLAYAGYSNLIDALEMCDQTKSRINDFMDSYCHNGVFMENIWGLHEGKPSPDRWVSASDMKYPCTDLRIAEVYLPECWYNQSTYIMNHFYHGDRVKAAVLCNELLNERSEYMCLDGIFRSINMVTGDNLNSKYEICSQMSEGWKEKCISVVASAYLQQGDMELPFKICNNAKFGKKECFYELGGSIDHDYQPGPKKNSLCKKIPSEFSRVNCKITGA
jgi:hypothetical protein